MKEIQLIIQTKILQNTKHELPNLYVRVVEVGAELNIDILGELEADWLLRTPPNESLAISFASVESTFSVVILFSLWLDAEDVGSFRSESCKHDLYK